MVYKIALTGRFRTGKDTVASLVGSLLPGRTEQFAFANALKRELAYMVGEYIDVFDDRVLYNREMHALGWQWWGEFRRKVCGDDYWIRQIEDYIKDATDRLGWNVIITDMRHLNEAEWCRKNGFFLVRVEGPCRSGSEVRDPNHPSERDVDNIPVDTFVINDGTVQQLDQKVRGLLMPQIRRFFDAVVSDQNT